MTLFKKSNYGKLHKFIFVVIYLLQSKRQTGESQI